MAAPETSTAVVNGNLVRWLSGKGDGVGVITASSPSGRKDHVRFDDGESHTFAWPNEALERVRFSTGDDVHLIADDDVGVVLGATEVEGRIFYTVNLAGGTRKTVLEDGIRRALLTDPVELMRRGLVHGSRSVNLRLAATRLLFAHQFDNLSSLSNSRVEVKHHQVGVVHRVATSYPHRFLLADEVGLGKTIEAGLVLKELKARGVADRVLVMAPPGLVSQWQFELRTKFNETFALLDSRTIPGLEATHPGENVWSLHDNVITSSRYAAFTDRRMNEIALAGWDVVILDEAHHARRTLNNSTGTRLYRLAQQLAAAEHATSRAMLLLTATPMQLHPFELFSLLELLDPTLFASFEDFDDHRRELAGLNLTVDAVGRWTSLDKAERSRTADEVSRWLGSGAAECAKRLAGSGPREAIIEELRSKHRVSELLVRNRKAVVGGFMPRVAAVWEVDLTEDEWAAYHAATSYALEGFERARIEKNNALGFLMVTFQKLACSSSAALRKSLEKRIAKLQTQLDSEPVSTPVATPTPDEEEVEEVSVAEGLDDLLAVRFRENTEAEVSELRRIVELLGAISLDSKTRVLVERLTEILERDPDARVIVFTQYLETQAYVADNVPAPWTVTIFNGGLRAAEKDRAVAAFRDGDGPQLFISSEAGGEGRNLQFSHMLVNYDLPWNPMKVEQRIGRIDRIGQKKSVSIFNLSTTGTVEERVLHVLSERIGLFEETIGGLDPILGEVEGDLKKIFALADERADEALLDFERRLESRVSEARAAERHLADLIMDTRSFRKDEVKTLLDQHASQSNEDLERFVLGSLTELEVGISNHADIEHVYDLRLKGRFADEFPAIVRDGDRRTGTLDPSTALDHEEVEFFAFGHEVVDALVGHVRGREYPGLTSHRVIRTDDVRPTSGWLFVYALEFDGVEQSKEVLPIFVSTDGQPDDNLAGWLLDRSMRIKREEPSLLGHLPQRNEVFEAAVAHAETTATRRLLARQSELGNTNRERVEQERAKLQRFYEYKGRAATEKLRTIEAIYERLFKSEDEDDKKILPVWATNLENARRMVIGLEEEGQRRLDDLAPREQVRIQHELLTLSFVEITPDPRDELREMGLVLPEDLLRHVLALYRETSVEDLARLRNEVSQRADQLAKLAEKHSIDRSGIALAARLAAAASDAESYDPPSRALLGAAMMYFLLVDDGDHDLTSNSGFSDDTSIAVAVLRVLRTSS